jgi:hypothetical protein
MWAAIVKKAATADSNTPKPDVKPFKPALLFVVHEEKPQQSIDYLTDASGITVGKAPTKEEREARKAARQKEKKAEKKGEKKGGKENNESSGAKAEKPSSSADGLAGEESDKKPSSDSAEALCEDDVCVRPTKKATAKKNDSEEANAIKNDSEKKEGGEGTGEGEAADAAEVGDVKVVAPSSDEDLITADIEVTDSCEDCPVHKKKPQRKNSGNGGGGNAGGGNASGTAAGNTASSEDKTKDDKNITANNISPTDPKPLGVFIDEKREWYDELGTNKKISLWNLIRPDVIWSMLKRNREHSSDEVGGNLLGEGAILGGVLVFDPQGKEVFRHVERNFGDAVNFGKLRKVIEKMDSSGAGASPGGKNKKKAGK